MTYTDQQGRPEIVMHPNILRGTAAYRLVEPVDAETGGAGALATESTSGQAPAGAAAPPPRSGA